MEIALGVLLGLLGLALVALAAWLLRRRAGAVTGPGDDDLPGFLESPPGTAGAPSPRPAGWAVLPAPAPPPHGRDDRLAPAAVAAVGVLLAALAVAVLTGRDDDGRAAAHDRPAPAGELTADLTFDGVVLERHAVGVTAAYPTLHVTSQGGRARASLELETFHCLTGVAPGDPVAAGCRRAPTEYADLRSPALALTTAGDRLTVSGDFATYLRPAGGGPEPTGRVYPVAVSVASAGSTVEGTLDLGAEHAGISRAPGLSVLRRGS